MRYEDASGAFQASGPIANDDADTLSAGQRGPATGNLITGEGTQYGSSGADSAAGAHITAIAGKGGEDSSFSGGRLSIAGEHGRLTVDADGNYSYLASGNVENVRDRFTYTLADSQGNSDTAALIIEIGKTPAVIKVDAQQIVPGPDGVVTLPPGVELSDIRVVGRNLVVDLPDGTQLIIIDGAVFVPQLVLGGVEIPATNVATLLIGQEPQPAAGELPPSSGGNFALPPPPLDPGVPLGDLIPPTEFDYIPPEPEEVIPDEVDRDPEITIQPDGQPASVNAVDSVDEKGLPTRPGEPQGSGEEVAAGANGDPSEATAGTIIIDSPDDIDSVTINGVLVTGVIGQEIDGDFGTLTITGFDGDNILYSYVLSDNTSGNETQDDFEVILTDDNGDTATATLTINIIDDVPTARPDTDSIAAGQFGPATGNVLTDASAGDAGDGDSGADTVGADNASITAVSSANVPANSDSSSPFVVNGQYGVLTLQADGSYSYVRNPGTPGGVNDVFNYTLTDGDGDTSTTTLTISIADTPPSIDVPVAGEEGTQVNEEGLPTRNGGESAGSGEIADGNGADNDDASETTAGVVTFTPGDGPATIRIDGVAVTSVGQTFNGDHGVLTITAIGPSSVSYSYTLSDNSSGDATSDNFAFSVTDQDGDAANGNLVIDIVDDVPSAVNDTDTIAAGSFGPATGNVITDAAAGDAGDSDNGADTVGADNATISGLASVNVPANIDNSAAGGFVVNGQYGVLTMQADGSYSYVRNPGTAGGVNDVFTYSLTDGDGDVDTATLTIEIGDARPNIPTQHGVNVVSEAGLPARNGGEPAGTGEIADGDGTNNSDTSETISGSATISGGDGPLTVTIDGVALTSVGQTFVKPNGVLTITAINAGSIDYTFTLTDNTSGNATNVSYAVVVTDQDGDTASGTFIIDIVDDAPSAVNDTDSIGSGGSTATGNVITDASPGDAGDSDSGADMVGADNASISGLASNNIPANVDNNPAGGFVVVGQHGTLTMQADGSYSYVRSNNDPGTFQDVFTYTLTDGDGDSDTATLTIDISDAPTSLDVPTQGEAGTLVSEVGLPTRNGGEPAGTGEAADGNGADNDDTTETTAGVISFTAPDTPATVTIDGVAVTGTVGQTFNGAHGVLTITSYNAATGQIGYSYTLADNTSGNATFDDFAVVVTDNDGDTSSATLTINIVDDAPMAADDADSIAAGQYGPATGNVITDAAAGDAGDGDSGADNVGADNAQVSQIASNNVPANVATTPSGGNFVVNGQYGVLTIGQDGNYSYFRNPGTAGGVQDVFTYTLTDGDGDTTTATLTISIANSPVTLDAPDEGEAGTVVDEQGLPTRNGGEPAGTGEAADGNSSDNDEASETTVGVISFSAPDGPATITIDGVAITGVPGQTFAGSHGTLTITSFNAVTGQIGYSYTLADNTSGDATFDDFALQVIDQDGDVASDTLTIDIVDDEPLASNDVDSVVGGVGPATGNVLTGVEVAVPEDGNGTDGVADNPGADGGRVTNIDHASSPAEAVPNGSSTDIEGDYGVLTIYSNGDYSYLRNADSPGGVSDVFTYTLTDGDGDTVTATLTIGIDDKFPNPPANVTVWLDDDTELGGNANGPDDRNPDTQNASGTLVASGGDGDLDYFFSATQNLPTGFTSSLSSLAGVQTLTISQNGTPVITVELTNESGQYTVTQIAPIDHAADGNTEGEIPLGNILSAINVSVHAQDQDGDQSPPGTISISVDDDTPTINVAQTNEAGVVLTTQDAETDGNPTAQDTAVSAINFGGVFALTQSAGADGAAAPAALSFDLNVTAQNSGLTSQGLVINLFEVGGVIFGTTAGVSPVDATTPGVVFSLAVSGTGVVTLTQYQQVDHAPEASPVPGTGAPFDDQFATLVNGKITLTASSTITDGDGDQASDQEVIDLGGNIRFADDGPDAVNDSASQATENSAVTVNVFANDAPGADGVNVVGGIAVVPGSLTGSGVLVYNNNGTFTYTPAAGEQGSVTFQYRLTDFDGDTDTATVTINLQPDSTPNAADGVAAVDDDAIGGNPASTSGDLNANAGEADPANPSEAIFHGQLTATSGGDTIASFTFASMHGTSGSVGTETVNYTWDAGTGTLTATGPRGPLFQVVVNQATGEYNLTLLDNVLHAAGSNENDASTNLTFTVTDSDGDTDTGTIAVTFDDDAPTIGTIENGTASNDETDPTSSGELNFVVGADSPASVVSITANNGGITSGGKALVTNFSGNVLTAYQDSNGNGSYDAGLDSVAVYTLTVDPAAGADGEWVFDLITPFDPTVIDTPIGGSSSFGAGPTAAQVLEHTNGTDLAVVTGYNTGGGFNEANWLLTGNASGLTLSSVNGSTSGWGVASNNFEANEFFNWDFGSGALDTQGGVFTPPGGVSLPDISTATFDMINYSGSDDIKYVVHFTDGSFVSGTIPAVHMDGSSSNPATHWVFSAPAGKFIADIEMFGSGAAPGKVDLVSVGVQNSDLDETISFNVTLQDADGDQVSGAFTVNVADGNTPSIAMAPLSSKMSSSSQAANDDYSSIYAATEGQKWSNGFGNAGNTGIVSSVVAASGLMAMSSTSLNGFNQPSFDSLVQDSSRQLSSQLAGHESLSGEEFGSQSLGSELSEPAFDAVSLSGARYDFNDAGAVSHTLDGLAFGDAASADQPSYAANQLASFSPAAAAGPVPVVGMPSAQALQLAGLEGNSQQGGAVEQIVADALGGAPTVDSVLANLPGGIAELAAIANLASPNGDAVPGWDMALQGASGSAAEMLFKADAIALHHDAVQSIA